MKLGWLHYGLSKRLPKEAGGCLTVIMNVIWSSRGNLDLLHIYLILLAITIIGIPCCAVFKLAGLVLFRLGRR
jgi:uncharacterized membrane protein YccF (DUF307 family)